MSHKFIPHGKGDNSAFQKWAAHIFTSSPLQAFPHLTSLVGTEGIFLLHSTFLLIGALFALVALPETRNKSFTELEMIFVKKERNKAETSHC